MSFLRTALRWLSLSVLVGCAHHGGATTDAAATRYRVDIDAAFHNSVEGADLPVVTSLADTGLTLHLELTLSASREFRDGSQGALVHFDRAWADSRVGGAGARRLDPTGLQGRSVELRTFAGKEILALDLVEHVAGGDRQADVFDLLWPILAPFPPPLDEGQVGVRTVGWPFRISRNRGVRDELVMTWENRGMHPQAGGAAWKLDYSGPWSVRGVDRTTRPQTLIGGQGEAKGTAWYRAADSELVAHDFEWRRVVALRRQGPEDGSVIVEQHQHFVGRLERLP